MKRIKDPLYKYIEIPDEWCRDFIDQPGFQRLRRIIQTSYGSLYPSALHNRFVHSLGVYHLGCCAADTLSKEVRSTINDGSLLKKWDQAVETFKLACLLHDYGHSPFSHSGEQFYRAEGKEHDTLDEDLISLVKDEDDEFSNDVATGKAAPHEIMSAIMAIEDGLVTTHKSLFSRCIVGYRYSADSGSGLPGCLENVLIDMLHSDTIDVDRLDYLIRDSFVLGYDSITIDYQRLLKGLRIVKDRKTTQYRIAFDKSAMSVLENVIYARDNEKKWIQSHPVILYDQLLVQHGIRKANDIFEKRNGVPLFTKSALSEDGIKLEDGSRVRLLSDDDIIFSMKNDLYQSDASGLVSEYYRRCDRRHPIWKSEGEFRALFHSNAENKDCIARIATLLGGVEKILVDSGKDGLINDSAIKDLKKERDKPNINSRQKRKRIDELSQQLNLLEQLRDICEHLQIKFDFAVITAKRFKSGFEGSGLNKVPIVFDESGKYYYFEDVSGTLNSNEEEFSLFYLYHKEAGKREFPKKELIGMLLEQSC